MFSRVGGLESKLLFAVGFFWRSIDIRWRRTNILGKRGLRLKAAARSLGCHTGNDLTAVATVNSEILVGSEDDGIGKRFGQAMPLVFGLAIGALCSERPRLAMALSIR